MTTHRSGRERFDRFRTLIDVVSRIIGWLPVRAREFLWHQIEGWNGTAGIGLRYCIARTLAQSCGSNVLVGPHVEIRGWRHLTLGNNVSIHRSCYIDAEGGLTIGDDVSVAHATSILSFEHGWDDLSLPIKYNPMRCAPVAIERDVWIGCGCRILAGVRIQSRSIVAAGAVVTKDVPRGSVVGGVPARVINALPTPAMNESAR